MINQINCQSNYRFSTTYCFYMMMDNLDAKKGFSSGLFDSAGALNDDMKRRFSEFISGVQKRFGEEMKVMDNVTLKLHQSKTENGFERTNLFENYENEDYLFEKVGTSISESSGALPPSLCSLLNGNLNKPSLLHGSKFHSVGLTGFTYPRNPHVPTLIFSFYYFEVVCDSDTDWWFGGSVNLIPYILHKDDCQTFHNSLKICCDKYSKSFYSAFKKNCDDHFCLKHRGEAIGIGGLFFQKLKSPDLNVYEFVSDCLQSLIPCYFKIVSKNRYIKYQYMDNQWQLLRQGRIVEFYLTSDKATEYALQIPEINHENILILLPPLVKWDYDFQPEENSKEHELLDILRCPQQWST